VSHPIGRRQFLAGSAGAALALSALSYRRVLGANDPIHMGLIGSGGRGRTVMKTCTASFATCAASPWWTRYDSAPAHTTLSRDFEARNLSHCAARRYL
jgi:hypothetical protein